VLLILSVRIVLVLIIFCITHHHSNSGGFLLHTLEVVERAIKRRNAKMLPIGANVEAQNEKKKEKEKINYSSTNSHSLIVFFSDWVRDFLCSNNTEL
jgi:hypothetical protein